MANLLAALEVALGNVAALAIVDRVRQVADRIYPTSNLSPVPQAWLDVQAERRRQIAVEGFDTSNDDASAGQIALAAGCYALHAGGIGTDWPGGIRMALHCSGPGTKSGGSLSRRAKTWYAPALWC
nr:hypothetical protein [Pseudomonas aeruginosa]